MNVDGNRIKTRGTLRNTQSKRSRTNRQCQQQMSSAFTATKSVYIVALIHSAHQDLSAHPRHCYQEKACAVAELRSLYLVTWLSMAITCIEAQESRNGVARITSLNAYTFFSADFKMIFISNAQTGHCSMVFIWCLPIISSHWSSAAGTRKLFNSSLNLK